MLFSIYEGKTWHDPEFPVTLHVITYFRTTRCSAEEPFALLCGGGPVSYCDRFNTFQLDPIFTQGFYESEMNCKSKGLFQASLAVAIACQQKRPFLSSSFIFTVPAKAPQFHIIDPLNSIYFPSFLLTLSLDDVTTQLLAIPLPSCLLIFLVILSLYLIL